MANPRLFVPCIGCVQTSYQPKPPPTAYITGSTPDHVPKKRDERIQVDHLAWPIQHFFTLHGPNGSLETPSAQLLQVGRGLWGSCCNS